MEIDVIERKKLVQVEEKEIDRRERELQSTVKSPAEAESYRVNCMAEARKIAKVMKNLFLTDLGIINSHSVHPSVEFKRRKCRNFRQLFVKIKFSEASKHLPEVHFRQLISVNQASAK